MRQVLDKALTKHENFTEFVYVASVNEYTKIGMSSEPLARIKGMQTSNPYEVVMMAIIPTENMGKLENSLHFIFASKRARGEWFLLSNTDIEFLLSLVPVGFVYKKETRLVGEDESSPF